MEEVTRQMISSVKRWPRKEDGRPGFYASPPKVSRCTLLRQFDEGCLGWGEQGGCGVVAADGFRVYFKQAEMSPDYVWRWLLTSVSTVKNILCG